MNLGEQIKKVRTVQNLTQSQLAEKTGVSLRTIQRIEKDEVQPSSYSLQQLEKALSIDLKKEDTIQEMPSQKVYNISLNINTTEMRELIKDLKKLIGKHWKILLAIILLLLFLKNYTEIKSGLLDGWSKQ
ncbi:Helix-turn-helix [Belliella buryatensis]|uniref:Helix-turn-helix n=1 Tax=Belliella buryatensis TaxID=1500549 RepID=A0A239FA54_9BACT|nr:helix-turn-helix transcriptional regulator [Belliella buryatensis]SNS53920.1 Helix-turn-helix [Belliella buryatensis]